MNDSNPNSTNRLLVWLLVFAGILTVVTSGLVCAFFLFVPAKKLDVTASIPSAKSAPSAITPINLAAFYDKSGSWDTGNEFQEVPRGLTLLGGVPFEVNGLLRLSGRTAKNDGKTYRDQVNGIPVRKKFGRLHVLHIVSSSTSQESPYARITLRYADGSATSFPMIYGQHGRDWHRAKYEWPSALGDPNSKVVWRGEYDATVTSGKTLRIFKTTFTNPKPGEEVTTIDLSTEDASPNATIIAMSVGPANLPAPADDPPSLPEPEVPYEGQLKFIALDAVSGKPVPGVKIRISGTEPGGSFKRPETVTDAKGECLVEHPGDATTSLAVSTFGDGVPEKTIAWRVSRTGEPIPSEYTFRVTKAVTMGGLVQDESGQPVSGATLSIGQFTTAAEANALERVALGLTTQKTDEKGRWEFRSLPVGFGNFYLTVSHPEYTEVRFYSDGMDRNYSGEKVSMRSLLETNAVLKVRKGLSITGRVLNTNGEPLGGARVLLGDSRFVSKPNQMRTDDRGEFRFSNVGAGTTYLTVQATGHAPDMRQVTPGTNANPIEIRLAEGNVFKARVVDEFDTPVRTARVVVDVWQGRQTVELSGTTDSRGTVTIRSAPRDGMTGSISKNGYMYLNNVAFVADGKEQKFVLRKNLRITGSVVDAETKEPIEQFDVTRGQSYGGDELYWQDYNVIKGRFGEFNFALDQQNTVALRAEADDYLPTIISLKSNTATHLVFELKKGSGPKGIVHSADGQPAEGAQVAVVSKGSSLTMGKTKFQTSADKKIARTSATGAFSLRPEPDGEKIIVVHTNGYAELPFSNFVSGSTITLERWGVIEGVLKIGDALGTNQSLLLTPETGNGPNRFWYDYQDYSTTSDAQGRFVIFNVPPGERRLVRLIPIDERSRMHSPLRDVTVKSGEVTRLTVGGDGTLVTGQLALSDPSQKIDWKNSGHHYFNSQPNPPPYKTAEEYRAWEKLPETIEARKKARYYAVQLDERGTFRIEDVLPGNYALHFNLMQQPNASGQYQTTLGSLTTNIVVSARGDAAKTPTVDLGRLEIPLTRAPQRNAALR